MSGPERVEFLGVAFTNIGMADALAWLRARNRDSPYAYVVTPNVDHVLNLQKERALQEIYARADLCLCDSRVLARLAQASALKLHVVPGSELVAQLLSVMEPGRVLSLIASSAEVADRLRQMLPHVTIRCHVPPMGLRHNADAQGAAIEFVRASPADYILLAVGSPQQEMLADLLRNEEGVTGTALCIGASISFFTGEARRAPRWMQRLTLEWAYRLASEPRRLAHRYLVKGPAIFPAYLRWRAKRRKQEKVG